MGRDLFPWQPPSLVLCCLFEYDAIVCLGKDGLRQVERVTGLNGDQRLLLTLSLLPPSRCKSRYIITSSSPSIRLSPSTLIYLQDRYTRTHELTLHTDTRWVWMLSRSLIVLFAYQVSSTRYITWQTLLTVNMWTTTDEKSSKFHRFSWTNFYGWCGSTGPDQGRV